jgi:type I restriction enzyme S subunit
VIGHIGANCGSVVWAKGKHFVTYNGVICKIKDGCNPRYGYYLLLNSNLKSRFRGAAQPFISYDLLEKVIVYNPPKDIQDKIASILSAYDNLIENNNKRICLLEQMAENLYKEWFVRFRFPGHEKVEIENGLPKGWKYENLFNVAKVSYGYAFKSELFCDDTSLNAVVRIRDIQDNHTDTYTSEGCDDKYLIEKNAVLIGMDGIFHMCLWNGDKAYLNQRVVMLNSKYDNLCNYYLFMAIHPQVKFWEQVIAGTTVAHLGDKHLRKVKVIIPDKQILEKANTVIQGIMDEKNKLFTQNQLLIRQRDLLLPRLISGKLEVK